MNSPNLKNLAKIGKLKKEQVSQSEFDGLVKSGRTRLADARTPGLSMESRFDLTYIVRTAFLPRPVGYASPKGALGEGTPLMLLCTICCSPQ